MSQYNLGSLSSSNSAIQVVAAGDPPTLVLNHSTKNTVYIGNSNSVGSGNLLDATPLDPYASIVVDGTASVWAVAAVQTLPATVYTYQNAINWSPKAVQPNITDPNSPFTITAGSAQIRLTVPPGAQGVALSFPNPNDVIGLVVLGIQSGMVYSGAAPSTLAFDGSVLWIPVLSDADSQIQVTYNSTINQTMVVTWIMGQLAAAQVVTGASQPVEVVDINLPPGNGMPVTNVGATSLNVAVTNTPNVSVTNTPTVVPSFSHIDDRSLAANQAPLSFNVSLAAGATTTLLPASVGVQYFLHDLWCQINSGNMLSFHIQDTSANDLGVFIGIVTGTPANAYRPANPPFDFKGAPLATGLGVVLKNGGATTESFVGSLTYSK